MAQTRVDVVTSKMEMGYAFDDGKGGHGLILNKRGRLILATASRMAPQSTAEETFIIDTPEGRMRVCISMEKRA